MTTDPSRSIIPVTTKTRNNRIPSGWRWVPLRDVARLESGHTPSRRAPEYWQGGDVPWLSLKDVHGLQGRRVYETADHPTMLGIDNSSARMLPKDTVALCRTASVGKIVILGRDMATSQDFVAWVCGPEIIPEYLYEAFRASGATFEKEKQGSTHKTIYMPTVERFCVLLPPLPEQRRIAAILDKGDAIRRKRQEAIRLTDQFLRSAFLEMFGDPASNRKGFPRVKLSELAAADGIKCGPFGTQLSKSEYRSNGVPLWGIKHVNVHFRLPTNEFLDGAKAELLDQYSLEPGDIVMTRKGTIGNCAVYPSDFARDVMHSDLLRIRIDTTRSLPICLTSQLTLSGDVERQIAQISHGAVMAGINVTKLKSIEVLVPPMPLQRKFAQLVERHARTYNHQIQAGQEAQGFFHWLVQLAFCGQL